MKSLIEKLRKEISVEKVQNKLIIIWKDNIL
jgi:hypothetical protein